MGRTERSPLMRSSESEGLDSIECSPLAQSTDTRRHLRRHRDRLARARRLLYVSHLFAQFSELSWQFCLILFLGAFANYESLILVSTYGLVSGLAVCLTGSWVGRFIDHSNRLVLAQRFIWWENVCVLVATICCYLLLNRANQVALETMNTSGWLFSRLRGVPLDITSVLLLIGIHLLGSIAKILDRGFVVAIERDWLVVMSRMASPSYVELQPASQRSTVHEVHDPQERAWLTTTNVAMKQIDLSCKVIAPAVAGFFIAAFDDGSDPHHGGDLTGAALFVGALNVVSLVVEYVCSFRIYQLIPDLAAMRRSSHLLSEDKAVVTGSSGEERHAGSAEKAAVGCYRCQLVPDGLRVYFKQKISWGGLGLALLYLNALTFGAIMTAYLVWRGMRLETVGVWRGISSAVGLLGTFVSYYSLKLLSLESTGMWSVSFQFFCLSVSYASLFVANNDASIAMLIAGVCASRIGLWVFDIAITQQMQEYIPEDVRGVVGGVQQSLNAFFGLLSFGIGIIFPDPREFHIFVLAGYTSVFLSMLMYLFGVYLRQDKLRAP